MKNLAYSLLMLIALCMPSMAMADDVTNVALGKTFKCSHSDSWFTIDKINDNDLETRWSAGDGATGDNVWFYVDLGATYDISKIDIRWFAVYAKHYKVFTATTEVDGEPQWNSKPLFEQNMKLEFTNTDGHGWSNEDCRQVSTCARYVKVQQLEADSEDGVQGMSVFEFRVWGKLPAAVLSTIKVNADEYAVKDRALTLSAIGLDQYGNPAEVTDATYTIDENNCNATLEGSQLTCNALGTVTLHATSGNIVGEKFTVKSVTENPNVALLESGATAEGDATTNSWFTASKAINGELEDRWFSGNDREDANTEHWLIVDLGEKYDLDLVEIQWHNANAADYSLYVSDSKTDFGEAIASKTDVAQGECTHQFHKTGLSGRYIKVLTTKDNVIDITYGVGIIQLRAYGKKYDPTSITSAISSDSQLSARYDLQGRQINGNNKGIYIQNGKKFIK